MVSSKDKAHRWVQGIEKIWDFYFELFGQRQGKYGDWLLSCDRIAMDCYQAAYTGLGVARTVPAPPPFCYMKTGSRRPRSAAEFPCAQDRTSS